MNMQNNFPKIALFLSFMFFCVLLFVFLYFFRGINNNNQESQLREMEWQTEVLRREKIKMLDHSIKVIEKERVQLETHFAQSSDIVPFLDTIESLAPKAGVKAEVLSVNILEDHTGLYVNMKAMGNFDGLYKFLTLLENSPYELEFIGVDLQKEIVPSTDSKTKQDSRWSAIFKIKLLSFVE